MPWPGIDCEKSTLFMAGLLDEVEEGELVAEWKAQFNRSFDRGFFYCGGVGKILDGVRGRSAHYRACDVPATLVRQWIRERKRAIRELRPR